MTRLGVVFACLCVIAPAYGVQEITLRDLPPLQPLHSCKHSDGQVVEQIEPCASDTTEVSSVIKRNPDGTVTHVPLGSKEAIELGDTRRPANDAGAQATQNSNDVPNTAGKNPSPLGDFWKRIGKWVGFAVVVGLVAKFLNQSFALWLILGFVLRMVLVALNVMAF